MIRVALFGVSHWHLRLYLDPLRANADVTVVGVSDPDAAIAARVAAELGCASTDDHRALVDEVAPDAVMVLGRHADMAEQAEFLIERGIPFAVEKPAGLDAAQVTRIAALAEERGAFAAVPFVFRQSDYVRELRDRSAGARFDHLSFTMIGRPPQQYERMDSAWMLDRSLAGGGALVNLGIHFLDLVPFLVPGEPVRVVGAAVSSSAWGYDIDDFAAVTLQAGDSVAVIQTGYRYTSPDEYMDLHFSVRSSQVYSVVRDPHTAEFTGPDGALDRVAVETTNVAYYPRFVDDVIDRIRDGRAPLADLGDAAAAMRLLDEVYAVAGAPPAGRKGSP